MSATPDSTLADPQPIHGRSPAAACGAQRDQSRARRGAGTRDRHRRGAGGHQCLARRSRARFDAMLEKAHAPVRRRVRRDDDLRRRAFPCRGTRGVPAPLRILRARSTCRTSIAPHPLARGEHLENVPKSQREPYRRAIRMCRALVDLGGARSTLAVPLRKDDAAARRLSRFIARRFGRSPTSRSRCCRISPRRRSSRWRTRG